MAFILSHSIFKDEYKREYDNDSISIRELDLYRNLNIITEEQYQILCNKTMNTISFEDECDEEWESY